MRSVYHAEIVDHNITPSLLVFDQGLIFMTEGLKYVMKSIHA